MQRLISTVLWVEVGTDIEFMVCEKCECRLSFGWGGIFVVLLRRNQDLLDFEIFRILIHVAESVADYCTNNSCQSQNPKNSDTSCCTLF